MSPFKFEQNIDFDNLLALKPLDGELLKRKSKQSLSDLMNLSNTLN